MDTTKSLAQASALYRQKAKTNKTAAWVFLGSGFLLSLGGTSTNISSGWGGENKNKGIGIASVGLVAMGRSIPLFIAAKKNKRKAAVALKQETVRVINSQSGKRSYLALSIRLVFPAVSR